jgi:hypothetical protein
MKAPVPRAFGTIGSCCLAATASTALMSSSVLTPAAADARIRTPRPLVMAGNVPERLSAASMRPRHIPTAQLRADRRGDTPFSSTYFKITNITSEVYGSDGAAVALNDDGRIGYNDYGNGEDIPPQAFIVNNGGSFGVLSFPSDGCSESDFSSLTVSALNENAEAVGSYICGNSGYLGWSLSGASGSSVIYSDQSDDNGYAVAVNDRDVAVGCDGQCYSGAPGSAAIFTRSLSPGGRITDLRGFKDRACFASATAINDAGQIVGFACGEAVRFSTSEYAQALGVGAGSAAEAINQHGDIVGSAGSSAFLERDGRNIKLPKPAAYGKYAAIAYAVNAADEAVGTLYGPGGTTVAFAYADGHAYTLDSLLPPHSGWTIADAYGVNDHGEIVGDGYYNGTLYGISLKPPLSAAGDRVKPITFISW